MALAFGIALYRARVQAIAHDEALEYEWFLDGGVYNVLAYNPANHVLFTLLAKPIVWALGVNEFTLRAPSLIGAAVYLTAIYLLCINLFGNSALLFLSVTMLSLNPQILEFMPAARGYILGLACLSIAMYIFARLACRGQFQPDDKEWRWGCAVASVFVALSVAANFTNVVPAVALMLSFATVALGGLAAFLRVGTRTFRRFFQYFVMPGIVVGLCVLWPYLIQARPTQFKINLDRASDALREIFAGSFLYKWTDAVIGNLGGAAPYPGSWQERISDFGTYVFLPLMFLFVASGLILVYRTPVERVAVQDAHGRIFGGAAIGSVTLIVLLHVTAKVDYPLSRYCLFMIPMFTIGTLLVARHISYRFPRSYLRSAGLLIAAIVVCDYGLSLQTAYFRYNAYDVISRKLFQTIANDAKSRGLIDVRVGGTWWYEPEINFYRRRYNADWMKPYDIQDRSYFWRSPDSLQPADYDYYVYIPANDPGLTGSQSRRIFQDGTTHLTVVANDNPLRRALPFR
jgi:hypothetical protein